MAQWYAFILEKRTEEKDVVLSCLVLGLTTSNSALAGRPNGNLWCIGIEFSRNVNNDNAMPEAQIAAGVKLVADIKRRYRNINIYTHDQFNVGRTCPGPNFPLSRFKSA